MATEAPEAFAELAHPLSPSIRLWHVDLDRYATTEALSGFQPDEAERAARFRFERDRRRYLAARHALRRALGLALSVPATALRLGLDRFGKPLLLEPAGRIHFNLSHSEHECLIGTCLDAPVGVDLERLRAVADAPALAQAHFTPAECRAWEAHPPAMRDLVFLRCWTRKEASLKAVGVGLSVEPSAIDVGCDTRMRVLTVPTGHKVEQVTVRPLSIADNPSLIAAVALVGATPQPPLPSDHDR